MQNICGRGILCKDGVGEVQDLIEVRVVLGGMISVLAASSVDPVPARRLLAG
jgi:hypothetical protein